MIIRTAIELCAAFEPGLLSSAGLQYVGFDGGIGGKIGWCREQGMIINRLEAAVQIDSIEYRTRKFAPVTGDLGAGTLTVLRAAIVAKRAGVGGSYQTKVSWELGRIFGAANGYGAIFEWLPQGFEHLPTELGKLIQKYNTMVAQANFAGL